MPAFMDARPNGCCPDYKKASFVMVWAAPGGARDLKAGKLDHAEVVCPPCAGYNV